MRTIDARVEAEGKASKKDYPEAPAVGTRCGQIMGQPVVRVSESLAVMKF
jgi:hypothetical protein